jgi:cytochrome P450
MDMNTHPDIGYDPFDIKVMTNPYPYYRQLRASHPIYYTPKYDTFWVSRYADLEQMLALGSDVLISSESSIPMPEVLLKHHDGQPPKASLNPMPPMTLLHSPHYEEIRRAHSKPFSPGGVHGIEGFTRATARRLLDECLRRKSFDLFLDYGGMLSALLTCELFEIDESMAPEILKTVNATTSYDPERGGIDNSLLFLNMKRFMTPSIARRRAEGADGSAPLFDPLIH